MNLSFIARLAFVFISPARKSASGRSNLGQLFSGALEHLTSGHRLFGFFWAPSHAAHMKLQHNEIPKEGFACCA